MQKGKAGTHTLFLSGEDVEDPCLFSSQLQPESYGAEDPQAVSRVFIDLPQLGGRLAYNGAMANACRRLVATCGAKWRHCR